MATEGFSFDILTTVEVEGDQLSRESNTTPSNHPPAHRRRDYERHAYMNLLVDGKIV